jgi:hypothetical protein
MINATLPFACDGGVSDRVMRDWLTAARAACRRVTQSRIWTTVLAPVQSIAMGCETAFAISQVTNHLAIFRHYCSTQRVPDLVTEKLHELCLVTSCLQFVQDLSKSLLAHLSKSLRCKLSIRSCAAHIR